MVSNSALRFSSIAARLRGWLPLLILPPMTLAIAAATAPRWATMWALAVAIFAGCKWLTWRRSGVERASLGRHAGYLFAWPGLDAPAFLGERLDPEERPTSYEVAGATWRTIVGASLFWGVARLLPSENELVVGWVGMVGLILALHFGSFHLLSCFWRANGVVARPLMNGPLRSTGLAEFWGKRWNTAFRDLTHRFLFRPLTKGLAGRPLCRAACEPSARRPDRRGRDAATKTRYSGVFASREELVPSLATLVFAMMAKTNRLIGPRSALAIGFLFSGLVHDVVISIPAGGGYGGPTLYFLLQGAGLFAERSKLGNALGLGRGWPGRLFTAATLLLPVGLLFHPPFVTQVIVPFMRATAALS